MKAFRITREAVEDRERNPKADVHSVKRRLRAFEEREAKHDARIKALKKGYRMVADKSKPPIRKKDGRMAWRTRREPVQIDQSDWGLYIMGGDKGTGKSLVATALAERDWCEEGRLVFSNLGFEFGFQIKALDLYVGIAGMPPNSTLIIDEAHQPLATVGAASYKNLSVRQMLAGLRKINGKILMLSSQPDNIDGQVLNEADYAMTPQNCYPGLEKARANAQGNAYANHPWLWKKLIRIGPRPYMRRKGRASDIFAAYKINVHGPSPKKQTLWLPPSRLWYASLAYDSFSPLLNPLEAGMGVTAAEVKAGLADDNASWIDFGEAEDLAEAHGDPAEMDATARLREFEHARMNVFVNALFLYISTYKPALGGYTTMWAAEQVTDTIKQWPESTDAITDMLTAYEAVPRQRRPHGDQTIFTTDDARRYLSSFAGTEGRTFQIKRFVQACVSQGGGDPYED